MQSVPKRLWEQSRSPKQSQVNRLASKKIEVKEKSQYIWPKVKPKKVDWNHMDGAGGEEGLTSKRDEFPVGTKETQSF